MQQRSKDDRSLLAPPEQGGATVSAHAPTSAPELTTGTLQRSVLAGRYEILGLIGAGGMGTVYRAVDRELDEVVAVKVLIRDISAAPGVIERFRREVKLSRKVTHPNVARVFDIGEHSGDRFLTMELVDGESLAALLARVRRLPVDRALEILDGVCTGLAAAHRAGVVHRDLKPDNVLLSKDGRVVLTDFGIARALQPDGEGSNTVGGIIGTPAYMAPEQVQGAPDIDARADVYALGAMLYEMLTGERPWRGDTPLAVAAARLLAEPPDPRAKRADIPDALARAVTRCMARDRDARFPTVEVVAQELASLTQPARSISVRPAPPSAGAAPQSSAAGSWANAGPSQPCTTAPSIRPLDVAEKSVAVLPFRNQGGADDAYLVDELTDDLIDTLSMTRGLKVRPRGVVARFKDVDLDPRAVGCELDVQVVVEGSVRRRDGGVRISARLISVADGFQLWAKRFDCSAGAVLSVNDEAAQAIAQALTLDLAAPARATFADSAALDLFLRGRHEYRLFWPGAQRRAIPLFEAALARAPGDPMILAALALAHTRLWFFTGEGGEVAEQTAARAVAAAPELAEARLAMAAVRLQHMDVVGAIGELKLAVARRASLAEAHALLAHVLLECGDVDEGLRGMETAVALDPDVPLAPQTLARTYMLLDRWVEPAEAQNTPRPTNAGMSDSVIALRHALWRRDPRVREEAVRLAAAGFAPPEMVQLLDYYSSNAPRGALPAATLDAGTTARRRAFVWQLHAEVAAYCDRVEQVLVALTRSLENGFFDLLWLERCAVLDAVRADPRYEAIHAETQRRASAIVAAYRGR